MVPVSSSIAQQITFSVNEADQLLDALRKQDAKNTVKQLKDLLIEYIMANIQKAVDGGSGSQAKEVAGRITALEKKYSSDIQNANNLERSLDAMKNNPQDATSAEETYLQKVVAALQHDLQRGDMSDLSSLIQG